MRSEFECIASCIALSNVHRLSSSDELSCFGRHRGRCEDVDPNRAGLNADLRLLTQRADMNLSASDTVRRGVDSQAFGIVVWPRVPEDDDVKQTVELMV